MERNVAGIQKAYPYIPFIILVPDIKNNNNKEIQNSWDNNVEEKEKK